MEGTKRQKETQRVKGLEKERERERMCGRQRPTDRGRDKEIFGLFFK